jgi:hypothetical protein
MNWSFDLHRQVKWWNVFHKNGTSNPKLLLELGKLKRFICM